MKKATSLLLVLTMVLSLFAGCGKPAAQESTPQVPATTPTAETAAPTTEPTIEPTLSPEELLYNSLTDRQRQAVDVGIVELSQMEDLERECTIGEAAHMLQNAYTRHNGKESKLLADVLALDYVNEPAYLGWIGRLPVAMQVEALEPEKYENYDQWLAYVIQLSQCYDLSDMIFSYDIFDGYSYWDGDDRFVSNSYGWFDIGWSSGMGNYLYRNMPEGISLLEDCAEQGNLLAYSSFLYDHTTGHKVLEVSLYDEVPVEQVMTIGNMAEMAFRTLHSFCRERELAPYAQCVAADASILTEELMSRETSLPNATCNSLPSEWHGVTLDEVGRIADEGHYDEEIYEYEIQAIKDAGFNYIGLQIDFSWLQGTYEYSTLRPVEGQLDVNRLKKLDQILAWCMERDIHLDIRSTGVGRYTAVNAAEFAQIWSVLAQRYAQIPNTYLSFTILDSWQIDGCIILPVDGLGSKDLVTFVTPTVEAIREATPDRCIVLNLSGYNTCTDIPELGVALSANLAGIGCDFFAPSEKNVLNPDYYLNAKWPYQGSVDAESLLHKDQYWAKDSTVIRVIELAQENNLGFMFSGWGKLDVQYRGSYFCSTRYPDETYQAFIKDMTETMEDYGYGWCYEEWYGNNGITFSAPIMKNVTYEQIGDYPMYYDTAMLGFFKEVNGVQ